MDTLDSTSLDAGSSAATLGSDPGSSSDATSPDAQASWDQAMADAGVGGDGGTDTWGNPSSGASDATDTATASTPGQGGWLDTAGDFLKGVGEGAWDGAKGMVQGVGSSWPRAPTAWPPAPMRGSRQRTPLSRTPRP